MDHHLPGSSAADRCRQLAADLATGTLRVDGPEGSGTVVAIAGRIVGASSPAPAARLGARLVGAGELDAGSLPEVPGEAAGGGTVDAAGPEVGLQLVARGLVTHDAMRLAAQEQVLDALAELLGWGQGATTRFVAGAPSPASAAFVDLPVDDALREATRRLGAWRECARLLPDLDVALRRRADPPPSAVAGLEPDEVTVLVALEAGRSLRELVEHLGYGLLEVIRVVHGLVTSGLVEVLLPVDEVGAAFDDAFASLDRPAPGPQAATAPEPDVDAPETDGPDDRRPGHTLDDVEADVSTFLRELSRLADDDAPGRATPSPPRAPVDDDRPRPRPADPEDGRRRRRGRFGRGS